MTNLEILRAQLQAAENFLQNQDLSEPFRQSLEDSIKNLHLEIATEEIGAC